MTRTIYVPPGGPPRVNPPSQEIYAVMGDDNIVQMLEDFYRELEGSWLRPMFADDMVAASRKSAAFFVGLLGGPPLYHQLYGNPAMRARHMPFPIDEAARQEWLRCFDVILADAPARYNFPAVHLAGFRAFLDGFSGWMVNTAPGEMESPARPI
jgi:hemoglobin